MNKNKLNKRLNCWMMTYKKLNRLFIIQKRKNKKKKTIWKFNIINMINLWII